MKIPAIANPADPSNMKGETEGDKWRPKPWKAIRVRQSQDRKDKFDITSDDK